MSSDSPPLHTLSPLERFSDRAEDYARYRPSYAGDAIAAILADLTPARPGPLQAADIGAGTGISSRLLADRGVNVIAIEPNPAMRTAAAPHPQVSFRPGTATATGLDSQSLDLVTSCQAFHWFEPVPALAEFHRILRPGGRLALMWNDWNLDDPLTAAYRQLIEAAAANSPLRHGHVHSAEALYEHSQFSPVQKVSFPYAQTLPLDAIIGRSLSSSYMPKQGDAHTQFLADITALHHDWARPDGTLTLRYLTTVYIAQAL
jgi:SAM-dependent methyltransferase